MKKCKTCGHELPESSKMIKITKLKIEVDLKTTHLGKSYEELEIPIGKRLLTVRECFEIHNDKKLRKQLGFNNIWIHIQQPSKFNEERGYVAGFYANSGRAGLNCNWGPQGSSSALGVRFCKDLK